MIRNDIEYIRERSQKQIDALVEQMKCEHLWTKHGHGFICEECGFYTGMNKKLNDIIYEEVGFQIYNGGDE